MCMLYAQCVCIELTEIFFYIPHFLSQLLMLPLDFAQLIISSTTSDYYQSKNYF